MEVQRSERALTACSIAAGLPLRRHLPAAHDRQRAQSGHRLVCDAGWRVAGSQGGFRAMAIAGKFRCGGETDQEVSRTGLAGEGERTSPGTPFATQTPSCPSVPTRCAVTRFWRLRTEPSVWSNRSWSQNLLCLCSWFLLAAL